MVHALYQANDRSRLDDLIEELGSKITTVGELNYCVTRLCHRYIRGYGVNYANLNAVVGVMECAKLELYRRVVSVYEDGKIAENGDVLPGDK